MVPAQGTQESLLRCRYFYTLGSFVYLLFCVTRYGWGWDHFLKEANAGKGLCFPAVLRWYMTFGLPLIVIFIYIKGYFDKFYEKGMVYFIPWMCIAAAFLAFFGGLFLAAGQRKNADKDTVSELYASKLMKNRGE